MDPVTLTSANTHLYRGARLSTADAARLTEGPAALEIAFRDGVRIRAEWLQSDAGDYAVAAPEFNTGAGQRIAGKTWAVSRVETTAEGAVAVLGERLA